jgi:ribose transport system permease protein
MSLKLAAVDGVARTTAAEDHRARPAKARGQLRTLGVLPATVVLILVSVLFVPHFTERANLSDLLFTMAVVGFVALGMTFVVASGNFVDLSVVVQIGFAAVCVIALQDHGLVVGVVAGLAAVLLVGAFNGFATAMLGANPVIVTLATSTIGMGLLTYVTKSAHYQGHSDAFQSFGSWRITLVPIAAVLLLAAFVVAHLVLKFASFGRRVKLVGANRRFALIAGIPVSRTVIYCFLAASAGSWAAGVLLASYSNTAYGTIGQGYEFAALAAVVIGGNSLFGGRVSVIRTALGLVLVSVLSNVLPLTGMAYETQIIAKGVVVVLAVVIDTLASRSVTNDRH